MGEDHDMNANGGTIQRHTWIGMATAIAVALFGLTACGTGPQEAGNASQHTTIIRHYSFEYPANDMLPTIGQTGHEFSP
jgi:hypothetical protein